MWNRNEYHRGIDCGLSAWWREVHDAQWPADISGVRHESDEFREGYFDALDDSDDVPGPLEE